MVRAAVALALVAASNAPVASARAQPPPIRIEEFVSVPDLKRPVEFAQDPSDPSVQYFVEQQTARIRVIRDGEVLEEDFLDLSDRVLALTNEQGLLGLAFPPDYALSGVFYVNYTNFDDDTHVSRFRRDDRNPFIADPDSEEVILHVEQPARNHNGGRLAFGPDGMLYIGMGDGGGAGDTFHRAQSPDLLLGKILRIDVSTPTGYAIPPDNPFVDDDPIDAREEIWAFGLRNPWKITFDDPARGGTGALLIADVGQAWKEEFSYEPPGIGGRNYGWRLKEGFSNFNQSKPPAYEPLTDPIHDYDHTVGQCIIGGYVYRGTKLGAAYQGRYFFGDFKAMRVFSAGLAIDANGEATVTDVYDHTDDFGGSETIGFVLSFGVDAEGEPYLCSTVPNTIFRIVPDANTDLVDFLITRGALNAGGLDDLRESDDSRMLIQSEVGFTAFEPNLTELVVGAQTSVADPIRLDLTVEARIDALAGHARVRLLNHDSGTYDLIAEYPVNATEESMVFENVPDPADYVRDADGRVEVKLRHIVIATFSPLGFESRYDRAWVDVY